MRAVVFHEHGGPEVLQYAEVPTPRPGPGEALIMVGACALNHLDLFVRRGGGVFDKLPKPHIGGSDVAGVVAEVGDEESGVQVGDHVVVDPGVSTRDDEWSGRGEDSLSPGYQILGEHRWGGCAEYVVVPTRNLYRLPETFAFESAAAAALVFLTAWRMLIVRGGLRSGESVAIVGAGGGVNTAAIQIAKLSGATVYAVTSSPEKAERALGLGADYVINYLEEDWSKAVFQMTGKRGVDMVVDNVGQATLMASVRAVARGGRIVIVGNTSGPKVELDIRYLYSKQISLVGSTMGSHQDFKNVMNLVVSGQLKSVVDRVFPMAEARAAHEYLEQGGQFGKVVLVP